MTAQTQTQPPAAGEAAHSPDTIASAILSDVFDVCQPAEGCSTAGLHSKVKAHIAHSPHLARIKALEDILRAVAEIAHENTSDLLGAHIREFGTTTPKNKATAERFVRAMVVIQQARSLL